MEKEIKRNERLEIRLSKEEKETITKYAKELEINASRLTRNIMLTEIESLTNKYFKKPVGKGYIKILKMTNNKKELERIKTP